MQGCRRAVFECAGNLTAAELVANRTGKIVSRRKSEKAMSQYDQTDSGLRRWNEAARRAFDTYDTYDAYDAEGFANDEDGGMEYAPNYADGYASGYDDYAPPSRSSPQRSPTPKRRSKRSTKGVPRKRLDL